MHTFARSNSRRNFLQSDVRLWSLHTYRRGWLDSHASADILYRERFAPEQFVVSPLLRSLVQDLFISLTFSLGIYGFPAWAVHINARHANDEHYRKMCAKVCSVVLGACWTFWRHKKNRWFRSFSLCVESSTQAPQRSPMLRIYVVLLLLFYFTLDEYMHSFVGAQCTTTTARDNVGECCRDYGSMR